jgi:hypothetical protein
VRSRHVAIASIFFLAGCGSSGSSTVPGTSAAGSAQATHAQFVAQAQAICRELKGKEAAFKQRVAALEKVPGSQEKGAAPLIGQIVALERAANAKLAALSEPPQDAVSIGRLVAGLYEEADDSSNIEKDFATGDGPAAEAAERALLSWHVFDQRRANKLGLQACVAETEAE